MNQIRSSILHILSLAVVIAFASCKKDKDDPKKPTNNSDDIELITTVILRFTNDDGSQPIIEAVFRDPDGEGGNAPTQFDPINLRAFSSYTCEILLLDESKNPTDTVSYEVLAEADEHLFCFDVAGLDLDIIRTDSDGQYELGLSSAWTTYNTGTGQVTIKLKHQPGIKNGSCDPGDTDIELDFNVLVEP